MPQGCHLSSEQKSLLVFHWGTLNHTPEEAISYIFGYMEELLRPSAQHIHSLWTKFEHMTESELNDYQRRPVSRGTRARKHFNSGAVDMDYLTLMLHEN